MYPYIRIGLFELSTYTVFLVGAFAAAIVLFNRSGAFTGERWWKNLAVSGIAVIPAIPGARLLSMVAETENGVELTLPSLLMPSGMAFYGGALFTAPFVLATAALLRMNPGHLLDGIVPAVIVALGIGRMGCLMAGCCWGQPTTLPGGIVFTDFGAAARPLGVPLVPTQVIESVACLSIALTCYGLLARRRRRPLPPGMTGTAGFVAYAIARFLIEPLRADPRGGLWLLSTSQIISLGLIVLGVGFGFCLWMRQDTSDEHPI